MAFSFITPELIMTGNGCLDDLVLHLSGHGHKAFIVSGKSAVRQGITEKIGKMLDGLKIEHVSYDGITSEPTDKMIEEGTARYKEAGCDMLIACGGGSPIDAMKAIALSSVTAGGLWKAPVSGGNTNEAIAPLPFMVAVPTTAGTGSEVTRFTVIKDTKTGIKKLIADDALVPDIALVDPELTLSMPEKVTVSTGVDALTHAIESFTSKKSQPLSEAYALSAVKRIFENISTAVDYPDDLDAREQMSLAALEAGISFTNSSTTIVHGMSRPIGSHFDVPHGIANAMLLPTCLDFAVKGCPERFAMLGRAIGAASGINPDNIAAKRFLDAVRLLMSRLGVPSLERYGIDKGEFVSKVSVMADEAVESGTPALTRREPMLDDIKDLYMALWPEQIKMPDGLIPAN